MKGLPQVPTPNQEMPGAHDCSAVERTERFVDQVLSLIGVCTARLRWWYRPVNPKQPIADSSAQIHPSSIPFPRQFPAGPRRFKKTSRGRWGLKISWLTCLLAISTASCAPTEGKDTSFKVRTTSNSDFKVSFVEVGNFPIYMVAADIDGDNLLDVATADRFGDTVTVLTGGLTEGFTKSTTLNVGRDPTEVLIADFDGAHDLDLAVLNNRGLDITIFLSKGSGRWRLSATYSLGELITQMAAVDLDGDGSSTQDIVATVSEIHEVWALINDGSGKFPTKVRTPANLSPGRFLVGDWNGDTLPDLAVLNSANDRMTPLLGDGLGSFDRKPNAGFATPDNPSYAVTFDFNGDGDDDIAVTNRFGDSVSIYRSNGEGGFKAPFSVDVRRDPAEMIAATLDDTGENDDLAFVHRNTTRVSVLLRKQNGRFIGHEVRVGDDPFGIAAGLFTKDETTDLAVVERDDRVLSILANRGSGNFIRTRIGFESRVSFPLTVDLDGAGGHDDLLLLQSLADRVVILENVH